MYVLIYMYMKMLERKTRMGRPQEVKGGGCAMTFYLNNSRVDDFRELCKKHGISVSEGLRQLMEQELEKNEVGCANPLNIPYGLHSNKSTNGITISLDKFMDVNEVKELIKEIPNEVLGKFFNYNIKKLSQQVQHKTTGRITT